VSYWRQVLAFAQSTKPSNSVIVFTKSRRAGEVFLQADFSLRTLYSPTRTSDQCPLSALPPRPLWDEE